MNKVEDYVRQFFLEKASPDFVYHDLAHTENVVGVAKLLCRALGIKAVEEARILIASWLHDIGHLEMAESHEERSVEIAERFLKYAGVDETSIHGVKSLILATKISHTPKSLAEKIIRDADVHYIGTSHYFPLSKKLRKEWEIIHNVELRDAEWYEKNLVFFKSQKWYTDPAKAMFEIQKQRNYRAVEKLLSKSNAPE